MDEQESVFDIINKDLIERKKGRLEIIKEALSTLYPEELYDIQIPVKIPRSVNNRIFDSMHAKKGVGIFYDRYNTDGGRFAELTEHYTNFSECKIGEISKEDFLELRKDYTEEYSEILNILSEYYYIEIIIKFPEVTIKNENGKTHLIRDLFAKKIINLNGKSIKNFTLSRSTFSTIEVKKGYIHSHLSTSNMSTLHGPVWGDPCLGQGPINASQRALISIGNTTTPEDLFSSYLLFFTDLNNYVKVESLRGIPYIKMEMLSTLSKSTKFYSNYFFKTIVSLDELMLEISKNYGSSNTDTLEKLNMKELVKKFIINFIKNVDLKYAYLNGVIRPAYNLIEFNKVVTREFINYYNVNAVEYPKRFNTDKLLTYGIMLPGKIKNNQIVSYRKSEDDNDKTALMLNGKKSPIHFKGEDVLLSVVPSTEIRNIKDSLIVAPEITCYIYNTLLKLNFKENGTNKRRIYI